jgi:hypothetical protein
MNRTLSLAVTLSLVLSSLPAAAESAQAGRSQDPPGIELREHLNRGEPIGIELKNGRCITGTVGDTQWDGFWLEHPPAPATFISFRATRALLDPDTGLVIGRTLHDRDRLPKWVWPTVGVVGMVAILVWASGGRFPLGFFLPRT